MKNKTVKRKSELEKEKTLEQIRWLKRNGFNNLAKAFERIFSRSYQIKAPRGRTK